jgi:transcriptional regulator with XRE-family HTH domain
MRRFQVIKKEVKLESILARLIERDGYSRNRKPILDSINVTAAALSQYVRGRTRPSFDKLLALSSFFDVTLDYLVYGEPTSTSVDPDPVARYVEQALMDVRARTTQHSELVARIGRLLMDRIDEVATEAAKSRSAGLEGLIDHEESLRVERYCLQASIVATNVDPNVIPIGGDESATGQFFRVVVENLLRGCTYRFLLAGELTTQSDNVKQLRQKIARAVGGDRLHEYCLFRTTTWPLAGAAVLYQLNTAAFAKAEPAIYAQFSKYLLDDTWLGYLNRPNDESTTDMLMAPGYVQQSMTTFEALWTTASE